MAGVGVGLGIHGHRADARAARGGGHAAGDFAAVGDQDFSEHGASRFISEWRAGVFGAFQRGRARFRPSVEQGAVLRGFRVAGGQQPVAVEDRIGAGQEAQRLHRLAHLLAAGRQAHLRLRHGDARDRDGAHELERVERLDAVQRRAFDLHQVVDRHRLRIRDRGWPAARSGRRAARAISPMPTMPPQQTLMPASRTCAQRVEAVLVVAGGDDARRRTRARCRGCGCSSRGRRPSAAAPARPRACPAWRRSPGPAPSPRAPSRSTFSMSRSFGRARRRPCRSGSRPGPWRRWRPPARSSSAISLLASTPVS